MTTNNTQFQYYLAGAFWGRDDQYNDFITSGRWESGYKSGDDEFPKVESVLKQMRKGDRIAIKKKLGQGKSQIMIRAIGIIKSIDLERAIVYVDWIVTGMKRKVACKNVLATLHGPYYRTSQNHAEWIQEIFSL